MFSLLIKHRLMVMLLGAALMTTVGCGGGEYDNLGEVSGKITLDGEPLKHAVITFQPQGGRPAYGKTGEDGKYRMMYTGSQAGATVGMNTVTITNGGEKRDEETGKIWFQKEQVPPKYNSKTELTYDVQAGSQTHDFELKTK
ncbi:carboxypeptidase regulatory-like domain-containing protein [Bremerella sp. P1]|uniref:carboxypeptidase regulatory-like domain-containing protein n=1 Tax=Bremerella sp. P1 TaxID=3026424 RepID=UPI0023678FF9|nr:carboxypeptidase regulatory-like domain-containing protein [Bremerella sp. P1]WDI42581.1 carboxypeptidase regulatory-like domain-containing protein [Bremerella sp. P1]